jgi:hypothetical protein
MLSLRSQSLSLMNKKILFIKEKNNPAINDRVIFYVPDCNLTESFLIPGVTNKLVSLFNSLFSKSS